MAAVLMVLTVLVSISEVDRGFDGPRSPSMGLPLISSICREDLYGNAPSSLVGRFLSFIRLNIAVFDYPLFAVWSKGLLTGAYFCGLDEALGSA